MILKLGFLNGYLISKNGNWHKFYGLEDEYCIILVFLSWSRSTHDFFGFFIFVKTAFWFWTWTLISLYSIIGFQFWILGIKLYLILFSSQ